MRFDRGAVWREIHELFHAVFVFAAQHVGLGAGLRASTNACRLLLCLDLLVFFFFQARCSNLAHRVTAFF